MSAAAINTEIKPREGFVQSSAIWPMWWLLADVSAEGSITDKPLADHPKAMRAAVAGHPRSDDPHWNATIATVQQLGLMNILTSPSGVCVRVGQEFSDWRRIGDWTDGVVVEGKP